MTSCDSTFFCGTGLGLLASLIYFLFRSFFKVDEGHLAVITRFGKAEMINSKDRILKTAQPGLHWTYPWNKVHVTSMMERNLDLSGENSGVTSMTEDGTILRLDSKLRYVPLEKELYNYLFVMKNPSDHIKRLFTCLLRNEIANFASQTDQKSNGQPPSVYLNSNNLNNNAYSGSYALIRRERRLLNKHIEDFCQNQISGRYGGVQFCAVDLTDILPPDELADALNAVIHAQTQAEALYAHMEAECQQRILSAEQGVAIAAARASAIETEILTLAQFLSRLSTNHTLQSYVDRRKSEVLAESRTVFRRTHK